MPRDCSVAKPKAPLQVAGRKSMSHNWMTHVGCCMSVQFPLPAHPSLLTRLRFLVRHFFFLRRSPISRKLSQSLWHAHTPNSSPMFTGMVPFSQQDRTRSVLQSVPPCPSTYPNTYTFIDESSQPSQRIKCLPFLGAILVSGFFFFF